MKPKTGEAIKLPGVAGVEAPLIVCVPIGATADEITPELLRRAAGAWNHEPQRYRAGRHCDAW